MSVTNLSWLKTKSQSVDMTAAGFNPLAGAGKPAPQASKPPAPKTPIIEEEQNHTAETQKHPSRRSELKRFYTIGLIYEKTNEIDVYSMKKKMIEEQLKHMFPALFSRSNIQMYFISSKK